jgi:hypothetical protein
MAQDWDIKPRSETCSGCDKSFGDNERYMAALIFSDEGYVRGDYCDECWSEKKGGEAMPFSMWQGVFHLPPPKPEDPLKKETVESLLRRFIEDEDNDRTNVIYILTVMLERKRVLIEKDVQVRDGKTTRVYEHRKTGETFLVLDPRLRLDELEEVQTEVALLLGGPEKKEEEPEDSENNVDEESQ